jgi:hypothetical protein
MYEAVREYVVITREPFCRSTDMSHQKTLLRGTYRRITSMQKINSSCRDHLAAEGITSSCRMSVSWRSDRKMMPPEPVYEPASEFRLKHIVSVWNRS